MSKTTFTPSALKGRSLPELRKLFASVQQELTRSEAGSPARRDALTSLETISLEIAKRLSGPRF